MWKPIRPARDVGCGLILLLAVLPGCRSTQVKPVDIFPEDNCALCRMAVSNPAFASEIITADGDALKFDDLSCLEEYRAAHPDLRIAAVFVKDYDSKTWLPEAQGVIVETGLDTPMGSGKVAVRDSARAHALVSQFPPHSAN